MRLGLKTGPPVRIVFFRSEKEFAPYAPNDFAQAFYLGAQDRDYIVMQSMARDQFPVAVHEYIHLLVKHSGIPAPVWYNEGLAELFSNLKPLGGKIEVGDMIVPDLLLLRQSKWIDLATLVNVQPDSPLYNQKSHAGLFYAESWALVHMLYLDAHYRDHLSQFKEGLKAGTPMPDLFQTAYGKSLGEVQKDLELCLQATTFSASLFNARLAKEVDSPEVSDSSPLEAGLVLAEIMANMQAKTADAREQYNRLAREYPKDWEVEQGLARLSLRENKRAEAMAHYARAAELGSTNANMYLDYGRLLREKDKPAEAVAILKRATELDPENRDARLELGFAYVVADQHAEAIEQLLLVKRVTPEQAFGYFHAIAYSYYRLNKKDEAKTAVANCRKFAKTEEEISRVDQLTEALKYEPRMEIVAERVDTGDQPPPKLRRRDTELAVAEGTLRQIDCMDGKIRMRIGVGADAMSFALLDLGSVVIKEHAPVDFQCGPQKPRRIRIEYEPKKDAMPETVGVVRALAFPE
jgi:tetratricopeptide (TPR) repeat protein